jgi:hypothetical protein
MTSTLSVISRRLARRAPRPASDNSRSARREHDRAMRNPRIAHEHQVQIGRALSRGEGGCEFCS